MSKLHKHPRVLPAKMETEREKYDAYEWCKSELRRMREAGEYDGDPEQWHPAARLTRLAEDPTSTPSLKFLCLKTLLEYVEMPKAAEVRALAADHPDTSITVIVAPWARGPGSEPTLPAPEPVDREEAEHGRTARRRRCH
ncbi:MAG: hypothetical protein WCA20_06410 [Candidatus Sulfotelmatobacter sp.]